MKIKLDPGAYKPVRGHATDAGLDLLAPESFWLHPGETKKINTGVHIDIPDGYFGLITSKSGLMAKGITSRGTIDAHYLGPIYAVLHNSSDEGVLFEKGMKLTQILFIPIIIPELEYVQHLGESDRGSEGFGSTGK